MELSYKQKEIIKEIDDFSSEAFDDFETVLEEKNELMDKISQFEEKLLPYKKSLVAELDLNPDRWMKEFLNIELETKDLNDIVKDLKQVIEKLEKIDQESQKLIKEKRNKLTQQLNQVKKGSQINQTYNPKLRGHATYIDDKS